LPAGQNISISITDKQRAILATSLSTPKAKVSASQTAPGTQTAGLNP
jgi:hypothetical protein